METPKDPKEIAELVKNARKKVPFINLKDAGTVERKVKSAHQRKAKFDNIQKIQFKCKPKSNVSNHNSLDGVNRNSPLKEIIYRVLVNNKGSMKLGDIVDKSMEILKGRKLAKTVYGDDIYMEFYELLQDKSDYPFEEVE